MNTKINNEFDGPNKDAENWWLSESSESDEAPSSSRPKTLKISHVQEDEFFDEGLDEKDELWVAKQRQGRVSDAILSCPGCFTMLTADCQQHQHHNNQYRAMLVVNCEVDDKYALKETRSSSNKDRKRKSKPTEEQQKSVEAEDAAKGAAGPGNDKMIRSNHGSQGIPNCLEDSTELFYAVRCAVCRTESCVAAFLRMFVVGILGAGAGASIGAVANVFRNGNKGRDRLKQELQEAKSQLLDFEIKARALELDRKESQDIADRCLAEKEIQQEKVQHLEVEKQALETKLAVLQEESTAQAHRHDEDFKVLKAKVADVLTRLISKAIDVQGATDELQDLGCTIELEESSEDARACGVLLKERGLDAAAWNGETDLLLANRQRMERLVSHHLIAAAAACSAAPTPAWSNGRLSSAASAFFPLIREPASHPRLSTPMKAINSVPPQGVATPVSSATSSGLTNNATDTDISRDQRHHFQKTAIPYKLSASTTSEPAVIKFVYNAKVMPSKTVMQDHDLLHGGSSGFFTSTSPPTTHRDSFLDDSFVDALPGRSSGRDASTAALRRR